MGCGASRAVHPDSSGAPTVRLRAKRLGGVDPRWDVPSFEAWLAGCPCVRLGFLRDSAPTSRAEVPEGEWVRKLPKGTGVDGPLLFACLPAAFALLRSAEEAATERAALLDAICSKGAEDGDLVWWDALAMESVDARAEAFRIFTSYKAQAVVLPKRAPPHPRASCPSVLPKRALLAPPHPRPVFTPHAPS